MRRGALASLVLVIILLAVAAGPGFPGPDRTRTPLSQKQFARPELHFSTAAVRLDEVRARMPNAKAWETFLDRHPAAIVYVDPRSGTASSIAASTPLIPGHGRGNRLTLEVLSRQLGRAVSEVSAEVVGDAARAAVLERREALGIDVAQLGSARVSKVSDGFWRVSFPQEVDGIRVRYARLGVDVVQGNLAHLGTSAWGNVRISPRPRIDAGAALAAGFAHAGGRLPEDTLSKQPALEILPGTAPGRASAYRPGDAIGGGYSHLLAWVFGFTRPSEAGSWEVAVDAHTGEVLIFAPAEYESQEKIVGGVYPVTNIGSCTTLEHCGEMQLGTPMPWTDTGLVYPNDHTNTAGTFEYTSGQVSTGFFGYFVNLTDDCGNNPVTGFGSIDLGQVNSPACTSPSTHSRNTHAARTTFYHLNKLGEMARGWLPNSLFLNNWAQQVVTNDKAPFDPCRAQYNPGNRFITLSKPNSQCPSLGEIATIGDHEWGHALDDNDDDADPDRPMSDSSEAYGDIAATLGTRTSCIGYGQRILTGSNNNQNCGTTPDGTGYNSDLRGLVQNPNLVGVPHCMTDCSGARDVDWARHADGAPDTPQNFVCGNCVVPSEITLTTAGPCGRELHCDSAPASQAAWDLAARDLQASPFFYDADTAFNIANRLFFQGSGDVDRWYNCDCAAGTSSGCGEGTAFMEWLTADDDDGVLENGTPHSEAIYAAFARHGIGCDAYNLPHSGCVTPASPYSQPAPAVNAAPACGGASLSWTAVQDAAKYQVFRGEGIAGCGSSRALVASPAGTSFTDPEVLPGRTYCYNVAAVGSNDACFGAHSPCVCVTPYPPGSSADQDLDGLPNCADLDDDNDGDPDTADCEPFDPTIHHGAAELCDGRDNNCVSGIDEGYPDMDNDGIKNCVDSDADGDGVQIPADCDDLNTAVPAPEDIQHLPACRDFVDNDCDHVIDLDCATDATTILPLLQTSVSGALAQIQATSTNNVYQTLTEGGGGTQKRLKVIYGFPGVNNLDYILNFEGFKNGSANDTFSFSYANSGYCGTDETYNSTLMTVVKNNSDSNMLQTTGAGTVTPSRPWLCIKIEDAAADSQADTVSIDRLYLTPASTTNCADADADGYTPSCSSCFNRYCPLLDCADADAQQSPGLTEGPPGSPSCSDGKDNDCNGFVDLGDHEQCLVAPPDVTAASETLVTGQRTNANLLAATYAADDTKEGLKEVSSGGKSKLVMTYVFNNVPSGWAHKLYIEAVKGENGDDNFEFWYSTNGGGTYSLVTGSTVTSYVLDQALQPTFGTGSLSGTIYIQLRDTNPTNAGKNLDSIYVDRLVIHTVP
jgi:putative metal-binding protein